MLSDFPNPTTLPGGYKTGQPADTSTYYNIWKAAENVVDTCVKGRGEVGWQATGIKPSLFPSTTLTTSLLQCYHGCWSICLILILVGVHG